MSFLRKKMIIASILALGLAGIFFGIFDNKKNPNIVADVKIEKGDSIWDIGKKLKNKKIIKNQLGFVFEVYTKGKQKKLKAGEYLISSNLNISEIIRIISNGNTIAENNQKKITFPEGWSDKQMAERLSNNGFSGDEFLKLANNPKYFLKKHNNYDFLKEIPDGKNLEGFLFPDTYLFANKSDAETIIEKMLNNFSQKLSEDLRKEIERQNKTIYEIITMASILEKEVKSSNDKKIVSGIFWKRMKNGQAFQSCATLAYILGENKKQYSYKDTKIESPYNTYLYPGLPPGPISNPGLDSILAAIYPIKTDYNYFLNNPETGKTVFSKTLTEHNINKRINGL